MAEKKSLIRFWIAPIAGIIAIIASLIIMHKIGKMSTCAPKTVEVAYAIRVGTYTFLKRQFKTIIIITIILSVLIAIARNQTLIE